MTATTIRSLKMGKRIGLSVLIASIAPSILAQSNCNNDSDTDSNSGSDTDSDSDGDPGQHGDSTTSTSRTSTSTSRVCTGSHTGSHSGSHTGSGSGSGTASGTIGGTPSRTPTASGSGALASSSMLQSSHDLTEQRHISGGAIAGTIVGILVALLLLALLVCFLRRRRRRQLFLSDKSALRRRGGLLAAMEEESTGRRDVNVETGKDLPSGPQQQQQQHLLRNIGHEDRNTMLSMTEQGSTLLSYIPSGPPTSSTPSDSTVSNLGHDRSSYLFSSDLEAVPETGADFGAGPESTTTHEGLISHQKELEANLHLDSRDGHENILQSGSGLDEAADPPPQYKE